MTLRAVFLQFVLSAIPFLIAAQGAHPILGNFFAEQRNETVYLQWTIKEGQTCNDIHIERAGSENNFERIGLISGVCGSADFALVYSFTDSVPHPNQVNQYRLELGTQGYTEVVSIRPFIIGDDQYLLLGNPVRSSLDIVFEDTQLRRLKIYNLQGHQLLEKNIKDRQASLNVNHLKSGIYLFTFRQGSGKVFHGRFAVSK